MSIAGQGLLYSCVLAIELGLWYGLGDAERWLDECDRSAVRQGPLTRLVCLPANLRPPCQPAAASLVTAVINPKGHCTKIVPEPIACSS